MAKDLRYLERRMVQIGKAIQADVVEFKKTVVRDVHYHVVQATPVDVGTARSNWIVRIGAPWTLVYKAFAPWPSRWRPPYTGGGTRAETANLRAAVRQAEGVLTRLRPGDAQTVYITNNLPYIARLNRGWSRQSPSGFVQNSVTVGVRSAVSRFRFPNLRRL